MQALLKDNPDFVYPAIRRNEVLGWVQAGVRDFSISRAATQWGINFPQDPKQTVYVWFDALNGYLSGKCLSMCSILPHAKSVVCVMKLSIFAKTTKSFTLSTSQADILLHLV